MMEMAIEINESEDIKEAQEQELEFAIDDERFVRAVVKEQGEKPVVKMISTRLEKLQEAVRGWIEIVAAPFCDDLDIIINEEGKFIEEEKPNFFLPEYDDLIVGNAIFVGFDMETSDHVSVTDEQIASIMKYLKENEVTNENINKEDYIHYAIYRM
jgi:hypothetical protein